MWWSKKDAQAKGDQPATPEKNGRRNPAKQMSARLRRNRKTADATLTASTSEDSVCLQASTAAIEVSLPNEAEGAAAAATPGKSPAAATPPASSDAKASTKPPPTPSGSSNAAADRACAPFSSVSEVLAERRKVYRAQFATADWKAKTSPSSLQNTNPNHPTTLNDFQPRNHRVPLFGNDQRLNREKSVLVQDAIELLRQHDVTDELECVKQEMSMLDVEIKALQSDRDDIETLRLAIPTSGLTPKGEEEEEAAGLDANRKLLQKDLTDAERTSLQDTRGCSLTVALYNDAAREAFLSHCGCKSSYPRENNGSASRGRNTTKTSDFISLSPHFCAENGAASTIQHISLLKGSAEASFLVSRDDAKSYYYGRLPDRLFRRMQTHGMDPKRDASELLYLSTGPLGCYYAEFRSGECWWGASVDEDDDDEFGTLCREWDVSRVVFGPGVSIQGGDDPKNKNKNKNNGGHVYRATSWIILARDGRAAWKNLPSRLHQALESRMASEAAPVEVALGYGDSYFVRFLDGSTDYSLPAHVAEVMEKRQLQVTAVYLHPDLAQDVVLRHR